jgi:hypothetical protein
MDFVSERRFERVINNEKDLVFGPLLEHASNSHFEKSPSGYYAKFEYLNRNFICVVSGSGSRFDVMMFQITANNKKTKIYSVKLGW